MKCIHNFDLNVYSCYNADHSVRIVPLYPNQKEKTENVVRENNRCEHGFDFDTYVCTGNGHDFKVKPLSIGNPGEAFPLQSVKAYEQKARKLRPSLLPYEGVLEGIKAMEFGATKYGAEAWREAPLQPREFLDALERHLLAIKQGEVLASDSGVNHLGHIIANAAILLAKYK